MPHVLDADDVFVLGEPNDLRVVSGGQEGMDLEVAEMACEGGLVGGLDGLITKEKDLELDQRAFDLLGGRRRERRSKIDPHDLCAQTGTQWSRLEMLEGQRCEPTACLRDVFSRTEMSGQGRHPNLS